MEEKEIQVMDIVKYIPSHAHGDENHPDVEWGIVVGTSNMHDNIGVLYATKDGRIKTTAQSTKKSDLKLVPRADISDGSVVDDLFIACKQYITPDLD